MINEATRAYIESKVWEVFPDKNQLQKSIQLLDTFFELAREVTPDIEINLEKMAKEPEYTLGSEIKALADPEKFMKTVLAIADPVLYSQTPEPLHPNDTGRRSWTLGYMYHQAFDVIPPKYKSKNLNLTNAAAQREKYKQDGLFYYYLTSYFYRNDNTHSINVYRADVLSLIIKSYLVVMLDTCHRKANALEKTRQRKVRAQKFDAARYCQRILSLYQNLEKSGFGYIDTRWFDPTTENMRCRADELLGLTNTMQVKLTGEAGSGKSTALKRMEYLLARQTKQNCQNGLPGTIPVYVELCDLVTENDILTNRIASVIGIDLADLDDFLCNESFCLLLDGFNEILDGTLKRKFAIDLDRFVKQYPKVRVFLTDRNLQGTQECPVLSHAKAMKLSPINAEDKKAFFVKNCHDAGSLDIILERLKNDPEYFQELDTPLKLKELITVVTEENTLPDDIVGSYIKCIISRERNEKKDPNMNHMEDLLAAFALQLDLKGVKTLPRMHAHKQMKECREMLGYSSPDVDKCIDLAINIGLLTLEGNKIGFDSEKYFDYFLAEAYSEEMVSLFE